MEMEGEGEIKPRRENELKSNYVSNQSSVMEAVERKFSKS